MAVQDWTPQDFPRELFFRRTPPAALANQQLQGVLPVLGQMAVLAKENQKKKDWAAAIDQLVQQNPAAASIGPMLKQNPELAGQLIPGMNKRTAEWQPVPGFISKSGNPVQMDKFTGEYREGSIPVKSSGGSFGGIADVRTKQSIMADLPSRSGPNTAAGAAYMVKVSARQGKSIIAKAGSPQRIALAAGDVARSVMRAAPQLEAMRGADFTNNFTTKINLLTQKLTADPNGKDVPKLRKEIYDLLDELDKSAQPWIENQLKATEDIWGDSLPQNWKQIRSREMGKNIPDVPFEDIIDSQIKDKSGAWSIERVQ